ncbi:MAG: hypothetical protein CL946_05240 [Ectothiorhodospiraceae bacterium]|nr:hypothetical protein [Ectothiorhodospiraceae bacterium]
MSSFKLLLVCIISLANAQIAAAQWNPDPSANTLIHSDHAVDVVYQPIVVSGDSGAVWVMWDEFVYEWQSTQWVKLNKLRADGTLLFGDTGRTVLTNLFDWYSSPSAIPYMDGGILYVLTHFNVLEIVIRDRDGNQVKPSAQFRSGPAQVVGGYVLPAANNGYYLVPIEFGWDWRAGSRAAVYHFDSSGTQTFSPTGVVTDSIMVTRIASDGEGGVLVGCESPQEGLSVKKVDSAGNAPWGPPGVNHLHIGLHAGTLQMCGDGLGGAFATWMNSNKEITDGVDNYIGHVNPDGTWSTGPEGRNIGLGSPVYLGRRTSMLPNGPGKAIVAWESYGDSLLVQCFDTSGQGVWRNGRPVYLDREVQILALVKNTPQTFIVFYSKNNGVDLDILAKSVSTSGSVLWNGAAKLVSTAPGDQVAEGPQEVAIPYAGGGFLAWNDTRSGKQDIYCTAIDGNGNALPVDLVSFTAVLFGADVLLQWRTASEVENEGFAIERSPNGEVWREIGQVAGNGTNSTAHEYRYVDVSGEIGTHSGMYYRLKQIDYDGTIEYSPVRYVRNLVNVSTVRLHPIHPNPASSIVTIGFDVPFEERIRISICDILGREQQNVVDGIYQQGRHSEIAALHNLTPGLYFVRMQTSLAVRMEKLLIHR